MFLVWATSLRPILFVYHPHLAKMILQSSEPKPMGFGDVMASIKPWVGEGLVTSNGSHWQRHRHLLTPAFHFDILRPYVDIFNNAADIMLEKIGELADKGESFDIYPLLKKCTIDIILKCAMSVDLDIQRQTEEVPYMKSCERLATLWGDRLSTPLHYIDWIFERSAAGQEFMQHCDLVHTFAENIINKRRQTLEKEGPPKKRYLDFVDILLTAKDESGQGLSATDIRSEVDTFLFAGHETSSTATSWLLHLLSENQDCQERAQQEVDNILNGRDSTDIAWSDLPKLEYVSCCIKETLRLYPPAPGIVRILTKDVTMDGVEVPSGTRVGVLLILMHRNPEIFPDPDQFQPDRFTKANSQARDPFAFAPFSAGPRNCIGQNFANNEMKVLASKILHKFHLTGDPARPVRPISKAIFHSESGVWLFAKRRTPSHPAADS
ncbi:hypothetical protein V1264_007543 [Littorina saxatilis]